MVTFGQRIRYSCAGMMLFRCRINAARLADRFGAVERGAMPMLRYDMLQAGIEPGLRFACLLDSQGGCRELDWRGVASWSPEDGFLWIHLERDAPEAGRWIRNESKVDPIAAEALLNDESRPTVDSFDSALLLILRGVNIAENKDPDKDGLQLVPIHIWIDEHRAITLRDREHALSALRDIRLALVVKRGPRTPGGLLVQICEKIVRDVGPSIEEMDQEVEALEDALIDSASQDLRRTLAELRRRAVHLRRYLGPQREALIRLQTEDTRLLDRANQLRLRCCIDSIIRYLEDMDALRDRTTILHEDLAAQIAEKIAATSNRLTAVAALLLPPSLIAGMLGANIGGIPGQESPLAFWEMSLMMLLLMLIQGIFLRRLRWL